MSKRVSKRKRKRDYASDSSEEVELKEVDTKPKLPVHHEWLWKYTQVQSSKKTSLPIEDIKQLLITRGESENDLKNLKILIHSINNVGEILVTQKSKINQLFDVLYIRAYDIIKPPNFDMLLKQNNKSKNIIIEKVDQLIDKIDEILETKIEHDIICSHDGNIKSFNMECVGKYVDLDKVDHWLSELLWDDQYQQINDDDENKLNENDTLIPLNKMDIYRMKAVLPISDGSNHYLSVVQDLYEIEKGNIKWIDNKDKLCLCKMVVIGKYLNKDILQKGFDSIFM
eukprot:174844_1